MDQPAEQMHNAEILLKRISPDLYRIYSAIRVIVNMGGNGSVEVHFVKGKIKQQHGLYIKPGFSDEKINK